MTTNQQTLESPVAPKPATTFAPSRTISVRDSCPSCGAGDLHCFYKVENVPVHSVLLMSSREQAVNYPKGSIHLAHCTACGFVFNQAFEPALMEYCSRYEETQGFSETFQKFHRALAEALDQRYNLKGKLVIEIGCGKGEFLALLCENTGARGLGFDPSYIEGRTGTLPDNIEFVKDFYSEQHAHHVGDLICCKMTLEHIDEVAKFVHVVASSIRNSLDAITFFQVPDASRVFSDLAFWDVYYEHCSYFSAGSLAKLFQDAGLTPIYIGREYDGQYLTIDAVPPGSKRTGLGEVDDRAEVAKYVEEFRETIQKRLTDWRIFIRKETAKGGKIVLWGGGSKAVAFLTTLGIEREIEFAVDINPHKHGYFLPGTGQEVVAPEFLQNYKPDHVIVMNSIYRDEVARNLASLGLSPRILTTDTGVAE